jgi:hypothetical protein
MMLLSLVHYCLQQPYDQNQHQQQQQPHVSVSDNIAFASGIASARHRSHSVTSSTTSSAAAASALHPYVPVASFEVADKPGALVKVLSHNCYHLIVVVMRII